MVDLHTQYLGIKAAIDQSVLEVIDSTQFINGSAVKQFQASLEAYLDVPHVIPCANGTDALQIAMMALGFRPGDEIIVPAFTYVATAEVIALLGLTPVMVDVDPHTFNITAELIEPAITPRTKAIVPVHLFGQSADMAPIMALAQQHELYVIEDNAQAIGADYLTTQQKTGTIGHIGCTSFFPSKNLGCYGDGGAIFTHDADLAARLRMVANHGQSKQYYHDVVGVNSRLDSLQAAVLNVKLPHLDAYNQARRAAADAYDQAFTHLDALVTPLRADYSTHVFHQYTLRVTDGRRDQLRQYLTDQGIPNMIYYPVPLYRQPAFAGYWNGVVYPMTEQLCQEVVSLPMHTELAPDMQQFIIDKVRTFCDD